MENTTKVPKLRFPEFRGKAGWEEKKLGEVSTIVRGGSPRPIEEFMTTKADGLNWLKIADVSAESKYITKTKEKVIQEALSKTRQVVSGDLILSNSMSFGRPYILNIETCIHDGWIAIREIEQSVKTDFLYYSILNEESQQYFLVNAAGSGVKNLNAEIIKLLPINIPQTLEQQKIADCLSSLDDLISSENEKLQALQVHKKGLMQQLFPAGGETVPKLRFSEFAESGDWEEKLLGEVCFKISDGIHSTPKYDAAGEYYFINGNNLVNGDIVIDKNTKKVSEEEYNLYQKELNTNTILLSINGTIGNLARYRNEKVILGKSACYINTDNSKTIVEFLMSYLQTEFVRNYFELELTGSTIKNLSLKTIKNALLAFPTLPEQQKIADCLSSLDALVAAQSERITALKMHKKGLMQQLFPPAG